MFAEEAITISREEIVEDISHGPRNNMSDQEDLPPPAKICCDSQPSRRMGRDPLFAVDCFDERNRVHVLQFGMARDYRLTVLALKRSESQLAAAVVTDDEVHAPVT